MPGLLGGDGGQFVRMLKTWAPADVRCAHVWTGGAQKPIKCLCGVRGGKEEGGCVCVYAQNVVCVRVCVEREVEGAARLVTAFERNKRGVDPGKSVFGGCARKGGGDGGGEGCAA